MNNKNITYLIVLFVAFILFSCKASEKDNVKIKVKHLPTNILLEKLTKNEFVFNTLSSKAAIVFDNGKKTSFKAHLRLKKDSAIWMSITPLLGVEVARVLITKDTVKVMNRMSSEFFIGDFAYINKVFGLDLDYQMAEALLIGNSIDFDHNNKVHSAVDRKKANYYISSIKKRKVKKELKKVEKAKLKTKIKEQAQAFWLEPIHFKIKEILLKSPEKEQGFKGEYTDHKEINDQLFPHELHFKLDSKKPASIDLEYSKVYTGKTLSFPFKIPTKYVQIQ